MKSNFKKLAAAALALVMVFSFAACSGGADYTAENTEYIIGVSGPLTGGAAV